MSADDQAETNYSQELLNGRARQDQEVAQLLAAWNKMPQELQRQVVDVMRLPPNDWRKLAAEAPDKWILFFQKTMLIGLRQCFLEERA